MPPSFHPRLVNGPFDDPGLFIGFLFEKRAILFDLGDLSPLSPKDILKVSHVFVSHTHMDHFIGFDPLLRLLLGREKKLRLYGPEGFLKNVEGKLSGYQWNLVKHYTNLFVLEVSEVRGDRVLTREYSCSSGFKPGPTSETRFDGLLLDDPSFSIFAIELDHKIPCLGFRLAERFHININKNKIETMGLPMGPWLNDFKKAFHDETDPDSVFMVPVAKDGKEKRPFRLAELADQIAIITPGQKIAYITDVVFSERNVSKIIPFVKDSDHLFIEACFLDKHRDAAREKHHLTAAQAGYIARKAGVKNFTVFHFSPRYMPDGRDLEREAERTMNNGEW